jgi:hypothetical protein
MLRTNKSDARSSPSGLPFHGGACSDHVAYAHILQGLQGSVQLLVRQEGLFDDLDLRYSPTWDSSGIFLS